MKKLLLTIAIIPILFLSGCKTLTVANTEAWLKQAFGDYIRSIEGQATLEKIPGLILAGRDKWLPKGAYWDNFAATIIRQYVAANPQNNAELNKALEEIATRLNTAR